MSQQPPPSPSGRQPSGYGELMMRVWSFGDWSRGEVTIEAPPGLPFPFWMVACENLIHATAQQSGAGYEKAIELLVDAAMSKTRGKVLQKATPEAGCPIRLEGVRLRSMGEKGQPAVVELKIGEEWFRVLRSDDWKDLQHPTMVESSPETLKKLLPGHTDE